ncbi:hypothetical protein KAH37_10415 [bacterium]|nr:hypothetical protein [bacterium]
MLKDIAWTGTEKIDGTNVRIIFDGTTVEVKGKSDKSSMPEFLRADIEAMFSPEKMGEAFPDIPEDGAICLYGEGYGKRIQKGGNYIPDKTSFILFDIRVGSWWLTRESIENIAKILGIEIVPIVGEFTLESAVEFVRKGFTSLIAHNKEYPAEGLILKPKVELLSRGAQRIIVKIKTGDFRKSITLEEYDSKAES